jgi:hypothetical protein
MGDFNGSACVLCYNRYSSTRGLSFEIKACGRPYCCVRRTFVHGSWRGSLLGPFLLELRRILFLGTRVLNRLETDSLNEPPIQSFQSNEIVLPWRGDSV